MNEASSQNSTCGLDRPSTFTNDVLDSVSNTIIAVTACDFHCYLKSMGIQFQDKDIPNIVPHISER